VRRQPAKRGSVALAFKEHGENKDAYDLYYVVRNYGKGVEDVAACIRPLLRDVNAGKAVEILKGDFLDADALGARRVAEFLYGQPNADVQADVAGFVRELLERCWPRH